MGPERNDAIKPGVQSIDQIRSFITRGFMGYAKRPIFYLIDAMLVASAVALFFHHSLPAMWYVLLVALVGAELGRYFYHRQLPEPEIKPKKK
jgi:uncharacterized membrane protein AbrB (regulator of aidB expression)